MKRSTDRILTTHVGSLARPTRQLELLFAKERGEDFSPDEFASSTAGAVDGIVASQIEAGIDVINDGEQSKASFLTYIAERLGGFSPREDQGEDLWIDSRETIAFPEFYDAHRKAREGLVAQPVKLVCTGPVTYTGHEFLQRDIANVKAAAEAHPDHQELFLSAVSPSDVEGQQGNEFYDSDEAYLFAIADAMREEYAAIIEAGVLLQIDDPRLLTYYISRPELSVEDCRRWAEVRVEALNHALRDLPEDRIRFHEAAPIYWGIDEIQSERDADAGFPDEVDVLLDHVEAPPALHRRLSQIGLVGPADGLRLQETLKPGQRLVSREGHLWRWDGLVAKADAPSPAAQRLAGRNRLKEITAQLEAAREASEQAQDTADQAGNALGQVRTREQELRQQLRQEQTTLAKSRDELATLERALNDFDARLETTRATHAAAAAEHADIVALITESDAALAALADPQVLEAEATAIAGHMRTARDKASELTASFVGLERERLRVAERLARLDDDIAGWRKRSTQSTKRLTAIASHLEKLKLEQKALAERPDELEAQRGKLRSAIEISERERSAAADAVAETETALREATTALRELAGSVAERREERARADARLEGARLKRAGIVQGIHDTLETTPEGCLEIAEMGEDDTLPSLHEADGKLARLRTDRERLGGVNLQAERELADLEEQHGTLDRERADVDEAIAKLRAGIASLNREGRKRLKEAFVTVDGHFQSLFQTLFDGGEARLAMIESDEDPLAGGLEIIAKPPGKKPTTLSLLSGGEQTLTALSLIFAVFLTNPSPICVLDEVDAPLDDANVDRFCRMMEKMSADTDTRFLCITHHPETMARMDRLFGVTMGEKGVSQLVSVDLQGAERFLEAGE